MSTVSRRYLFTMWEGGGTVPPELGVAKRLVARGHEVHVLADPTIAAQAEAAGCTFSPWRRAPHRTSLDPAQDLVKDWEAKNPVAMLKRVRDGLVAGPASAFAADTAATMDDVGPDVVVPDVFLFGSTIAAQGAGLPVVPLVPNIWALPSPGAPPVGPGLPPARGPLGRSRDAALRAVVNRLFNGGLPALNAARAEHGLAPLTAFWDQALDVDRILVLTSAAFDFASTSVPANVRYVGPILDEPAWAEPWSSPWPEGSDAPLVLVALSSTYQQQGPLLQRVVEALSSLPVRAVVTLGPVLDEDEVTSTDNVAVVRSAPHGQVLREAELVVTHCGHGTTMKALAAGVPMVCLPMGRDQNDTAARVVHRAAGVRLSPKASVSRIAQAVERVLGGGEFRGGAEAMAAAIAAECRADAAVAELEALATGSPAAAAPTGGHL